MRVSAFLMACVCLDTLCSAEHALPVHIVIEINRLQFGHAPAFSAGKKRNLKMHIVRLTAILIASGAGIYGQETARRLIVSIPDRKIALIEDGKVIRVYPVA